MFGKMTRGRLLHLIGLASALRTPGDCEDFAAYRIPPPRRTPRPVTMHGAPITYNRAHEAERRCRQAERARQKAERRKVAS